MPKLFRAFICASALDSDFVDKLGGWLRQRNIVPNAINLRLRLNKDIAAFDSEVSSEELGEIVLVVATQNFLNDPWLPKEMIAFLLRDSCDLPVRILKFVDFGNFALHHEAQIRSVEFSKEETECFDELDDWIKKVRPSPAARIFVSHSSKDQDLAKIISEFLEDALELKKEEIRCTSVLEYRLPLGPDYTAALCREIREADTFLALSTKSGLGSPWVLFELGARWATGRHCQPLLARGGLSEDLPAPFALANTIDLVQSTQLQRLVTALSKELGLRAPNAQNYQRLLSEVTRLAS